jgi:hypothetical protein
LNGKIRINNNKQIINSWTMICGMYARNVKIFLNIYYNIFVDFVLINNKLKKIEIKISRYFIFLYFYVLSIDE